MEKLSFKKLSFHDMEKIEGGVQLNKYVYGACGAIIMTMEYSIINPVWAAIHMSLGAGCMLVTGMSMAS